MAHACYHNLDYITKMSYHTNVSACRFQINVKTTAYLLMALHDYFTFPTKLLYICGFPLSAAAATTATAAAAITLSYK